MCSQSEPPIIQGRKAEKEIVKLDKELIKKKKWLARRREFYLWHRRDEAVGIPTLPPKKVSKETRLDWEMTVIRAEEEQTNTNAES